MAPRCYSQGTKAGGGGGDGMQLCQCPCPVGAREAQGKELEGFGDGGAPLGMWVITL